MNKRPAEAMLAAIEGGGPKFYRFVYANTSGAAVAHEVADFEAEPETFARLAKDETAAIHPGGSGSTPCARGETQE